MYDKKSLYGLNKTDPDHITYTDAIKGKVTLSHKAFSSREEFSKWKRWSDADYRQEEQGDNRFSRHNYPMAFATDYVNDDTPESIFSRKLDRREQIADCRGIVSDIQAIVTETQFRRMWLYYVIGKTEVQVALLEGCSHQMISKSLASARKKIMKKYGNTGCKTGLKTPAI